MNCQFCGAENEGTIAWEIKRKVIAICGNCWYDEVRWQQKEGKVKA